MVGDYPKKWMLATFISVILFIIGIGYPLKAMEPESSSDNLPFLQTRGTDIATESGKKVFLRGVNLGNWLLWEGVALGIINYPEHQLRHLMEERMGKEKVDLIFELIKDNYIRPEDFGNVKSSGLNVVRLPFHYRYVQENKYTELDRAVQWAKEQGVYIILDMHAAPGSQNTDYHSDSDGTAYLWENPRYQEEFIRLWEILAKRYKDEPAVAGYEILNEPVVRDGKKLTDLYARTIFRIRKIDKRHIIFLDGNHYASDFSVFTPPFTDNIVYVFHYYEDSVEDMQEVVQKNGYIHFQKRFQVPIMCSEFHSYDCTSFFNSKNIHWAPWNYKSIRYMSHGALYHLPPDRPWNRLIASIGRRMRANQEAIKSKRSQVVMKSTLSQECKQQVIRILNNPDDLKKSFFILAKKYPEDRRELGRVYLELRKIVDSYWMDVFTDSLQSMNEDKMMELMESLQTKYWEKSKK